jgi:hypothetical protein
MSVSNFHRRYRDEFKLSIVQRSKTAALKDRAASGDSLNPADEPHQVQYLPLPSASNAFGPPITKRSPRFTKMQPHTLRRVARQPKRTDWLNETAPKHYLYRAICHARSLYTNRGRQIDPKTLFAKNKLLFALNEAETEQLDSLLRYGFFRAPLFFSTELIDSIHAKADALFRRLLVNWSLQLSSNSLQHSAGRGFSYDDLAGEHTIELIDPLINIPEALDIAFHESVLKIVAHFFGSVPSRYHVNIVRTFPPESNPHATYLQQDVEEPDLLKVLIDLVDVDESHGSLVYVPGSNRCNDYRGHLPRVARFPIANRPLNEEEVERVYPRERWVTLLGKRGTLTAIHSKGIHSGPVWPATTKATNKPRTSVQIVARGHSDTMQCEPGENRMRTWNFDRMTELQQWFAHANFVDDRESPLTKAG